MHSSQGNSPCFPKLCPLEEAQQGCTHISGAAALRPCSSLYLLLPWYPPAWNSRAWPHWEPAIPRFPQDPSSRSTLPTRSSPHHPSICVSNPSLQQLLTRWPAWSSAVLAVALAPFPGPLKSTGGMWGAPGLAPDWRQWLRRKGCCLLPGAQDTAGKGWRTELEMPMQGSLDHFAARISHPALLIPVLSLAGAVLGPSACLHIPCLGPGFHISSCAAFCRS